MGAQKETLAMQITIYTSPQTAARHGLAQHGLRTVEIDAAALTQEERDVLARVLDDRGQLLAAEAKLDDWHDDLRVYEHERLRDVVDPVAYIRCLITERAALRAKAAADDEQRAIFVASLGPDDVVLRKDTWGLIRYDLPDEETLKRRCPAWPGTVPDDHIVWVIAASRNAELDRRAEAWLEEHLEVLLRDTSGIIHAELPEGKRRITVPQHLRERAESLRAEREAAAKAEQEELVRVQRLGIYGVLCAVEAYEPAQRYEAGVLPDEELDALLRPYALSAYTDLPRYQRIEITHEPECGGEQRSRVTDLDTDPAMSATAWARLRQVREIAARHGHDVTVRNHNVYCVDDYRDCSVDVARLGVRVRAVLHGRPYTVELALD